MSILGFTGLVLSQVQSGESNLNIRGGVYVSLRVWQSPMPILVLLVSNSQRVFAVVEEAVAAASILPVIDLPY
jgi:hypothetical protein